MANKRLSIENADEYYERHRMSYGKNLLVLSSLITPLMIFITVIITIDSIDSIDSMINNQFTLEYIEYIVEVFIQIATMYIPFMVVYMILMMIYNRTNNRYYREKYIDHKFHEDINTAYVDKNDYEKVYLLHEIIDREKCTVKRVADDGREIDLYLLDYELYNEDDYDQVKRDILNKIISNKQLSFEDAMKMKYDKLRKEIKKPSYETMREKDEREERLIRKNNEDYA